MTARTDRPLANAAVSDLLAYCQGGGEIRPRTEGDASDAYSSVGKRILDIILVLIVAVPVFAIMLVLLPILSTDGHSPFFIQKRVGRGGRLFRMYKLRTMVPHAEEVLEAHLASDPEARAEWDHHQKLRNDPRITRLGRLLRRSSVDELPQFLNVLLGDMSIVGPRPMMPSQRSLYPGEAYYDLRPGVTGLWQVSDRNDSSFAERALFDTAYAEGLSLRTDLAIMSRTVGVVTRATGH
ncbi:sugar transferase [Pseudoroseicyclus aestuarii]|uniref:Lipopolysaccharide/colanic/teichoic acid biosynthesis glycosyltransferase n=1 Tax=Pseudoroseicyclus aestuarii TaxID=1795041 RepID=A0A318SPX6_9RHOB|nr:sugar transferase [Pseudoroseicyclus aestuarii]PYE83722.1 lipopolysaccharide/colanic/teichoic acid biosynthesis glycosyltransferase [Pseudoroseicyclus aestuarii]